MALDAERRRQLLDAKLRAVVAATWRPEGATSTTFPRGAALVAGGRGWVLADADPARSLGSALVWAAKHGVDELHVIAESATGILARRASAFAPAPSVWRVEGGEVRPAEPDPPVVELPVDPRLAPFADRLRAAGADVVVEGGLLLGEVLGLEVARVTVEDGVPVLDVGVGKHDRHAQRLVHGGGRPSDETLRQAVAAVRARRRADAEPHPMRQLAAPRWLRAVVVADPGLVGAAHLVPVPAPLRPDDLRVPVPAPAAGEDRDGAPLLVVCSTGIDLDLVPTAADARLADARGPRLRLAVPARDDHPTIRALAAALADPAEVVTVPDDWRSRAT